MNLGENRTHIEGDIWRTFLVFQEDEAVQQEQKIALG
jgi:hypothetical protein